MRCQQFGASLDLGLIQSLFLQGMSYRGLGTLHYFLLDILHRFGHRKGDHRSKRLFKGILLLQEVDAAEDEVKSEGELLLAGIVER